MFFIALINDPVSMAAAAAMPQPTTVESELSPEQANKAFPKLMQWLEYIAEQDCHKLREKYCLPEDKGKTVPKPVKQLPYNDLRRMLYVVGSTNWKRIRRTLIVNYARSIIQSLNDHTEEWRLTPEKLIMSIIDRDGYSTDGSIPTTTPKLCPAVEMPKMEQTRIATLALDVWLTDDADNECFRIRNLVCGSTENSEQRLPANALRKLLLDYPAMYLSPRTQQWKRVRGSVIATNRQRILDWLITHQQGWRHPFDPHLTDNIIY